MTGARLQIVRRLKAPPEKAFSACSDPSLMARWYGPGDWTVIELRADVRAGGAFWFRMSGPPGVIAAEGTYEIVEPPHRLVHSWQWVEGPANHSPDGVVSRISYQFEADGKGTRLTFTQDGLADRDSADSHEGGWREAFEKLETLLIGEGP